MRKKMYILWLGLIKIVINFRCRCVDKVDYVDVCLLDLMSCICYSDDIGRSWLILENILLYSVNIVVYDDDI